MTDALDLHLEYKGSIFDLSASGGFWTSTTRAQIKSFDCTRFALELEHCILRPFGCDGFVTLSRTKIQKKNIEKPSKCQCLTAKYFKITSWSRILSTIRFWSQNGTTTQLHPSCFSPILGAPGRLQNSQKSIKIGIKIECFFEVPPGRPPEGSWMPN